MIEQNLSLWFAKAQLPLSMSRMPFIRGVSDTRMFQMDVGENHKTKSEYFRLYCGDAANIVCVADANPHYRQILLRVKEPPRTFTQEVWNAEKRKMDLHHRRIPPFARTYLMGMDESHLFIAELPQNVAISTVEKAHTILKPELVRIREQKTKILRQGEWFFLPLTRHEENELRELEVTHVIKSNVRIGTSRNPHVAEFRIGDFVKGKITHRQHRTVKLRDWHKLVKNTETISRNARFGWID